MIRDIFNQRSFKNLWDCGIPGVSTTIGLKGQQTRLQVKQIGSSRKEVRLVIFYI